jgi:hypothetical protein
MRFQIVNWRKRLAKFKDNRLRPGEQVRATMVLMVQGSVARGAFAAGLGGAARGFAGATTAYLPVGAISAAGRRYRNAGRYPVAGLAGQFPIKPLLLVLTDHDRVIVYSFVLVALTFTYETDFLASRLHAIKIEPGFLARKATLRFADGSQLTFDLPRVHEYKPFCERFHAAAAATAAA